MSCEVWKFALSIGDTVCEMPEDAQILHVATQNGTVCLWAEVETEAVRCKRTFRIYGTGHRLDPGYTYRGTARVPPFVWHVYEKDRWRDVTGPSFKRRKA